MSLSRFRALLIPLLAVSAIVLAGCISVEVDGETWGDGEDGSGNLVTEQRAVVDFSAVHVSGALRAEVTRGALRLEVDFDDNLLDQLQTTVSGNELRLSCRNCDPSAGAVIRLTMPEVERIEASGASRVVVEAIDQATLSIDVSGASRIEADGQVGLLEIDGSGASNVNAGDLMVDELQVNLSGATRVEVDVQNRVEGDLSGASRLSLTGSSNPDVDVDTSGGSSVS